MKFWGTCGSILALLAVISGAYAAHGLGDVLAKIYAESPVKVVAGVSVPASLKYLADFKTAAQYQFLHAIALLFVGSFYRTNPSNWLNVAGSCFLLGILLFSGSLYLLTLLRIPALGAITPLGGLLYIIGWGALAGSFMTINPENR